jgi:hypothetical protein
MTVSSQTSDLLTDIGNHGAIDHADIIGERRSSNLGDNTHYGSLHISGA